MNSKKGLLFLFIFIFSLFTLVSSFEVSAKIEQLEIVERIYPEHSTDQNPPPLIDGVLSNFEDEWSIKTRSIHKIDFGSGSLYTKYDVTRFYFLLNVYSDTVEDNQPGLKTPSDSFSFIFDVNGDQEISPHIDKRYTYNTGNGILYSQNFTGPNTFTQSEVSEFSVVKPGYGCSIQDGSYSFSFFPEFEADCNEHRFYEIAIDLAELGLGSVWVQEHYFGFTYNSPTPVIDVKYPETLTTNFTELVKSRHVNTKFRYSGFQPGQTIGFIDKSGNDLQADIEVVQVVQNYFNGMKLISGKDTVARVYVETNGPDDQQISAVVYLTGERDGVTLPGSPLAKLVKEAPLVINKSITEHSANFLLPDSWLYGNVKLSTKVLDFRNDLVVQGIDSEVTFIERRNPIVWVIEINTGTTETPRLGDNLRLDKQIETFRTMFASQDVTIVKKPWTTIGACTDCNFYDINDRLESYYLLLQSLSYFFTNSFQLPDQIWGYAPSGGGLAYATYYNNHIGRV